MDEVNRFYRRLYLYIEHDQNWIDLDSRRINMKYSHDNQWLLDRFQKLWDWIIPSQSHAIISLLAPSRQMLERFVFRVFCYHYISACLPQSILMNHYITYVSWAFTHVVTSVVLHYVCTLIAQPYNVWCKQDAAIISWKKNSSRVLFGKRCD